LAFLKTVDVLFNCKQRCGASRSSACKPSVGLKGKTGVATLVVLYKVDFRLTISLQADALEATEFIGASAQQVGAPLAHCTVLEVSLACMIVPLRHTFFLS